MNSFSPPLLPLSASIATVDDAVRYDVTSSSNVAFKSRNRRSEGAVLTAVSHHKKVAQKIPSFGSHVSELGVRLCLLIAVWQGACCVGGLTAPLPRPPVAAFIRFWVQAKAEV